MTDAATAAKVFELLEKRRPDATVCPSEVARALAPPATLKAGVPRCLRCGALQPDWLRRSGFA